MIAAQYDDAVGYAYTHTRGEYIRVTCRRDGEPAALLCEASGRIDSPHIPRFASTASRRNATWVAVRPRDVCVQPGPPKMVYKAHIRT